MGIKKADPTLNLWTLVWCPGLQIVPIHKPYLTNANLPPPLPLSLSNLIMKWNYWRNGKPQQFSMWGQPFQSRWFHHYIVTYTEWVNKFLCYFQDLLLYGNMITARFHEQRCQKAAAMWPSSGCLSQIFYDQGCSEKKPTCDFSLL